MILIYAFRENSENPRCEGIIHESPHEGQSRFPNVNLDAAGGGPLSYRWVSATRSAELSRAILLRPKNFP